MRSVGVFAALAIAMGAGLAGCGGSSNNSDGGIGVGLGQGSCTISESIADAGVAIMLCEEISGLTPQEVQSARMSCMLNGGGLGDLADAGVSANAQFTNAPCSRVNALGGCRVMQGGMTVTIWYYADPNGLSTSADIQMLCVSIGETFVAP